VILGSGAAASATDKVTVRYIARSAKTKRTFDSSWARGKDFSYDPAKIAFKGFTEGVPGMKVGGRRIVIVPGPLAYGSTPPPSLGLGPNETLVFVIDLVSIDK
jgi:peptidylprolyl isomerase